MSAKPEKPQSAFDILTDFIEDPHNNGAYRLNITGDDLRMVWKAVESQQDDLKMLKAELREGRDERDKLLEGEEILWDQIGQRDQANQILSDACAKALNERDGALQQAKLAWERHAEKDAAYQKALNERDQWREVAARMAKCLRWYDETHGEYCNHETRQAYKAYDALAKLSEKP